MPEFKKENPDTPATGLMSLIGASWKSLSQEEKDAYKIDQVDAKKDNKETKAEESDDDK